MADTQAPDLKTMLENVEEFVNDENNIVTYDWLSQSLGIHVNLAKEVLLKYLEKARASKSQPALNVIYSLGGKVGKNLKCVLVIEEKLGKTKATFDETLFEHVYSIQKGTLGSFEHLYNANYLKYKSSPHLCNEFSSIFCGGLRQRSSGDLERKYDGSVKQSSAPMKKEMKTESQNTAAEEKETKKDVTVSENIAKSSLKENNKPVEKKQSAGKPAIAAFFAKQQAKAPVVEKKPVIEDEAKKTNKRIVRELSEEEEDEDKPTENQTKRFKLAVKEEKEISPKPAVKQTKTKSKQGARAKPDSKKATGDQPKQRKRIQQMSESESSDAENSVEELNLPPSPAGPVAPLVESDDEIMLATPQRTSTANASAKNRSRKMKVKHHMDADGFVVTSRVYEECSESEGEVEGSGAAAGAAADKSEAAVKSEKAVEEKMAPKRPLSPVKNKQSSIMSFFSRK